MPFARPSLEEIRDRIRSEIELRIPGADTRIRRGVLRALVFANAGAHDGLYGGLDWISRQVIVDTAERLILRRWARVWGVAPTEATFGRFTVQAAGQDGILIPSGTVYQRADGHRYTVSDGGTIAAGTTLLTIVADQEGLAPNLSVNDTVSLLSPITGVDPAATVTAVVAAGVDEEDDESLRDRLVARIQDPPRGGAAADYVRWAREVAGVTRAWVAPLEQGEGTVVVRFVLDGKAAGGDPTAIIPTGGEVQLVQDYIDARRPVTADFTALAPVPVLDPFTVSITPDTPEVRAAVEAELDDLYARKAEPGATILLSRLHQAISLAAGEEDHAIVAPAADIAHAVGEMPIRGAVTWV